MGVPCRGQCSNPGAAVLPMFPLPKNSSSSGPNTTAPPAMGSTRGRWKRAWRRQNDCGAWGRDGGCLLKAGRRLSSRPIMKGYPMSRIGIPLVRHIMEQQRGYPDATGDFTGLLMQIALAAKVIAREVNKAGLVNILGFTGQKNVQGEQVTKLDVF